MDRPTELPTRNAPFLSIHIKKSILRNRVGNCRCSCRLKPQTHDGSVLAGRSGTAVPCGAPTMPLNRRRLDIAGRSQLAVYNAINILSTGIFSSCPRTLDEVRGWTSHQLKRGTNESWNSPPEKPAKARLFTRFDRLPLLGSILDRDGLIRRNPIVP